MTNPPPTVSVIISTFNRSASLAEAVRSVWAQSFSDYELIVIDDGSSDNTADVVCKLQAERPLRYYHQQNSGVSVARNTGLDNTRGRYVAVLDDDDTWFPYALEDAVTALESHPEHSICYSDVMVVDKNKTHLGLRANQPLPSGDLYQELVAGRVLLLNGAFMARTSCFAEVRYDPLVRPSEDIDMAWRLADRFTFQALPRPMLRYFKAPPGTITLSSAKYALEPTQRRYEKLFKSQRYQSSSKMFRHEISAKYELLLGRGLAWEKDYRRALIHFLRSIVRAPGRGATYRDALRAFACWVGRVG